MILVTYLFERVIDQPYTALNRMVIAGERLLCTRPCFEHTHFEPMPFTQRQRYTQTHAWSSAPAISLSIEVLFISMGPLNGEKNVFF
jgi:hypothetical protein